MMKLLDLDVIGDFLVMAATLMQIKSKMLLPADPEQTTSQEDPRDELVRRLTEYQTFKDIARELQEKELRRRDFYPRLIDEEALRQRQKDAREVVCEATLFDLITALTEALKKLPEETLHEIIKEEFTV